MPINLPGLRLGSCSFIDPKPIALHPLLELADVIRKMLSIFTVAFTGFSVRILSTIDKYKSCHGKNHLVREP